MSNGSELKGPAARALRAAGFKPLPRWWLTQEQVDLVEYMWRQNEAEVTRIRREALREAPKPLTKEEQVDRAWADAKKK